MNGTVHFIERREGDASSWVAALDSRITPRTKNEPDEIMQQYMIDVLKRDRRECIAKRHPIKPFDPAWLDGASRSFTREVELA